LNALRQFVEVILIAASGTAITIWGTVFKQYDYSTIGVLLLTVGAVLFIVRGPRYLNDVVYGDSIMPCLRTMNDLLKDLKVKGKSLILPPQETGKFEQLLVVGTNEGGGMEDALRGKSEDSILIQDAEGGRILRLVPLGNDLGMKIASQVTEEKHQSLAQVFQRVEDILIDMGTLSSLEAIQDGPIVNIMAEGFPSHFSCKDLNAKYPHICSQLLCPICSALACLVCYFAQRPVAVEGVAIDGKKVKASLRILEVAR